MENISNNILQLASIAKDAGLIQFLHQQISEAKNSAQEYIQDCDNSEAAERQFGKIEAFNEVLEWIAIR